MEILRQRRRNGSQDTKKKKEKGLWKHSNTKKEKWTKRLKEKEGKKFTRNTKTRKKGHKTLKTEGNSL